MKVSLVVSVTALVTLAAAKFNLAKKNNMVVYWGQNAHGGWNPDDDYQQQRLWETCKDQNIDVISVGFVNGFKGKGPKGTSNTWPELVFSNICSWEKYAGTGILDCSNTIGFDIELCQKVYVKKILISLGGSSKTYKSFGSKAEAEEFAVKMWDMFGNGNGPGSKYRPFGSAVIDGVDLDIELLPAKNYDAFAAKLRQLFSTDGTKKYYLTAAPQCPFPDTHVDAALQAVDFDMLFIQFYNNPSCAATNFVAGAAQDSNARFNYGQWHSWSQSGACRTKDIKMFVALPASTKVALNGYLSAGNSSAVFDSLVKYDTFGGAAFWDASELGAQKGYLEDVKTRLNIAAREPAYVREIVRSCP